MIMLPTESDARDLLRALRGFKRAEYRRATVWAEPERIEPIPPPLSLTPAARQPPVLAAGGRELSELRELPGGRPPLPEPLCCEEVMACCPGTSGFKRFRLSIDKLGVTLLPAPDDKKLPVSESINLPISAILDAKDGLEPPMVTDPLPRLPRLLTRVFGRRPADAEPEPPPPPPYPHVLSLKVKGSHGVVPPGPGSPPPEHRLHGRVVRAPVLLVLSFPTAKLLREAFAAYLAHKRYVLVLALSCSQPPPSAVSVGQPESEGVDECMVGRPANLPPQHKLPRMMTNEDGEIFWCVTRRERKPRPGGAGLNPQENPQEALGGDREPARDVQGGLQRGDAMQDQVQAALASALPALAEQVAAEVGRVVAANIPPSAQDREGYVVGV